MRGRAWGSAAGWVGAALFYRMLAHGEWLWALRMSFLVLHVYLASPPRLSRKTHSPHHLALHRPAGTQH